MLGCSYSGVGYDIIFQNTNAEKKTEPVVFSFHDVLLKTFKGSRYYVVGQDDKTSIKPAYVKDIKI